MSSIIIVKIKCRCITLQQLFQVIGYSSNLTIFISPSTVGKYTCHVSVRGYKDVSASTHVYARGPPVIVKSPERGVQYGSLGETVQVRDLVTLPSSSWSNICPQ